MLKRFFEKLIKTTFFFGVFIGIFSLLLYYGVKMIDRSNMWGYLLGAAILIIGSAWLLSWEAYLKPKKKEKLDQKKTSRISLPSWQ